MTIQSMIEALDILGKVVGHETDLTFEQWDGVEYVRNLSPLKYEYSLDEEWATVKMEELSA